MSVNTPSLSPLFDIPLSSERGSPTTRLVMGVLEQSGNLLLVVTQPRNLSPREKSLEWARVNAIRWDLEQVFDRNVFIAWDDE